MGDFNIDVNASGPGKDKLDEFCNLFDLTNLVKEVTCCTNNHRSTIDLILTNRPDSFQKTCSTETGVSDYHKCISTFFKSHYSKLKPKAIHYRNYKNFDVSLFLNDLEKTTLLTNSNCPNENYQHLTENFISVVEKHAPLKKKIIRGNQAPFVNRELRKAIYTRSRLRNKYWKNPTSENELRYKQQRNKCVSLRKKSMKLYLNKSAADGIVTNKSFWKFIKPFLKNKSCHAQNDIMLIQNDEIITEEKDLVEIFNKHYINIVEKSSGIKPVNVAMMHNICDNDTAINVIIEAYKNHPSVTEIKEIIEKNTTKRSFKFDSVNKSYITTILKNIDIKKPQV